MYDISSYDIHVVFFVAVVEKYYRCIVSRLPKAKTAIFLEGIDGELNFLHIRKDDEQKTTATSPYYTRPRFGDSGASVFRKIIYEGTEAPHGISKQKYIDCLYLMVNNIYINVLDIYKLHFLQQHVPVEEENDPCSCIVHGLPSHNQS